MNNISIDINAKSLGLLGPNGSGKTTFIKMITGLIHPTSGSIELDFDPHEIRVVPDYPFLPQEYTINDWIKAIEDIHGPNEVGIDIQTLFKLRGDWKIKNLSAGQTRKAALLPAFFGTPKLFILDEPTNFLDITSREQVITLLWEYMQKADANLILATHRIDEMRLFSEEVLLLKEGRVMKHVSNQKQAPENFTIQVDDFTAFNGLLDENNVDYETIINYAGMQHIITPSISLWDAIAKFQKQGGEVLSFQSNDLLKSAIEELIG